MNPKTLALLALCAASLVSACGTNEEGIILEIKADGLTVPTDINALSVAVLTEDKAAIGGLRELANQTYELLASQQFPLTIALAPSSSTPAAVVVHVAALLGTTTIAERETAVTWEKGMIVRATMELYRY